MVRVHNETELKCVFIATEDNYSRLQQVADKPSVYVGYANINYNNVETHHIAKQSWELVKKKKKKRRTEAITEMQEAVGQGNMLTELQEIYEASIDGRGELLIVHQDFSQAVVMKDVRTFDLVDDLSTSNAIDDITSVIAWEVISKKEGFYLRHKTKLKTLEKLRLKRDTKPSAITASTQK